MLYQYTGLPLSGSCSLGLTHFVPLTKIDEDSTSENNRRENRCVIEGGIEPLIHRRVIDARILQQ